jgi:hypothetical protein
MQSSCLLRFAKFASFPGRPYVRLSAAEVVDFDQLQAVWLEDEQA